MRSPTRVIMRELAATAALAAALTLFGCGTSPSRLVKKTVWFAVDATGRVVSTTVEIAGRTAVRAAATGVDLTLDAATALAAHDAAQVAMVEFWTHVQRGEWNLMYGMLSQDARRYIGPRRFAAQARTWGRQVRSFQVGRGLVQPHQVEIPTLLRVATPQGLREVPVRAYVKPEGGRWRIDGWEFPRDKEASAWSGAQRSRVTARQGTLPEARAVVQQFWENAAQGDYAAMYGQFSDRVTGVVPPEMFGAQAAQWCARLRAYSVGGLSEVGDAAAQAPCLLVIATDEGERRLEVTAHLVRERGRWRIDGWEFAAAGRAIRNRAARASSGGRARPALSG